MSSPGLLGASRIRALLDIHEVRLTKSLGQNFVVDPNTIEKVVAVAGVTPADRVLEIGAGAGSLTIALARAAGSVVALEIDERLRPVLDETTGGLANVEVVFDDALSTDLDSFGAHRVVANLPYNIAARVIILVLQNAPSVRSICVMTQREVAERLAAVPGSKIYGLTSAIVAFYASASVRARISRNVFFPAPSVDSALVAIERREPLGRDPAGFLQVARAAFGHRRKTIRNALTALPGMDQARLLQALTIARVSGDKRAEQLHARDFVAVADALRSA